MHRIELMSIYKQILGWRLAVLAIIVVPVTKIGLMFWEYELHFVLPSSVEVGAILAASLFAVAWAAQSARTRSESILRVSAMAIWVCFAYLFVAFIPGCIWAPACL